VKIVETLVDGNYDFLNSATSFTKSVCPKKIERQQNLSIPSSSKTLPAGSPASVLCLNSSHRWAIGFPQLKQRIGIIIRINLKMGLKKLLSVNLKSTYYEKFNEEEYH
jgi:hypothetical protein